MKHRIIQRTQYVEERSPHVCYVLQERRFFLWLDKPGYTPSERLSDIQRRLRAIEKLTIDRVVSPDAKPDKVSGILMGESMLSPPVRTATGNV